MRQVLVQKYLLSETLKSTTTSRPTNHTVSCIKHNEKNCSRKLNRQENVSNFFPDLRIIL